MAAAIARLYPETHLQTLLVSNRCAAQEETMIEKIMGIAKKTIGISKDNFYSWEGTGFDGIDFEELKGKKFVWGYGESDRLFIAFQFQRQNKTQNTTRTDSITISQRTDREDDMMLVTGNQGFHPFEEAWIPSPSVRNFTTLEHLLSGKPITREVEMTRNAYEFTL